jgi:hypothetical protein
MLQVFSIAPTKFSRTGVVMQDLLQPFLRQLVLRHCGLANKKGPQRGPWMVPVRCGQASGRLGGADGGFVAVAPDCLCAVFASARKPSALRRSPSGSDAVSALRRSSCVIL